MASDPGLRHRCLGHCPSSEAKVNIHCTLCRRARSCKQCVVTLGEDTLCLVCWKEEVALAFQFGQGEETHMVNTHEDQLPGCFPSCTYLPQQITRRTSPMSCTVCNKLVCVLCQTTIRSSTLCAHCVRKGEHYPRRYMRVWLNNNQNFMDNAGHWDYIENHIHTPRNYACRCNH